MLVLIWPSHRRQQAESLHPDTAGKDAATGAQSCHPQRKWPAGIRHDRLEPGSSHDVHKRTVADIHSLLAHGVSSNYAIYYR